MWLAELRFRDFRNYASLDAAFGQGITILYGPNAQGKSNLLEGVYMAAMGRSPRAGVDTEVIRFGQERAYVRALVNGTRSHLLEVAVDRTGGARRVKVNGVAARRGQLLGRMAVVLTGPLDDEVIRGVPGYRRRVLDVALSQISPSYFFALTRYIRVVRQRNRLLREAVPGPELVPWDEQLIELGAALTERRREFVAALARRARARHARIAGNEELDVVYLSAAGDGEERRALAAALAARRGEEIRRGATLVGPHRDDLRLTVNGIDLRMFGSRGQQHTAALSLRLAEAEMLRDELGEWPVLLLDDVLADLDPNRQTFLLREVAGPGPAMPEATGPQVLLTHTGPLPLGEMPVRLLSVRGGMLVEESDVRP